MQHGAMVRFAKSLLSRRCTCFIVNPAHLERVQYIWAQRCFSTSDTPSTSDNSSVKPQTAASKDPAKLAYERDVRRLRRKWQAEHAQKLADKAKAEAIKAAKRAVMVEGHRRKVAKIKALRGQIHEEKQRLQNEELVSQTHAVCATVVVSCHADFVQKLCIALRCIANAWRVCHVVLV